MSLPTVLILGGSACGHICGNGCYQKYNMIYAGLEEHCWATPDGEPCKTYQYRCDKPEESYSAYLDVQGDWYTEEFWNDIKHLLRSRYGRENFDIIQFPAETAKYLPGGLEVEDLFNTQIAANLIAANMYELLAVGGLLYIDYAIKYDDTSTDWVKYAPFGKTPNVMYIALENVGFSPAATPVDVPTLEQYVDKPKLLAKIKTSLKEYPLIHRRDTPLGEAQAQPQAQVPLMIPFLDHKQFVIIMEKNEYMPSIIWKQHKQH